MLSFKKLGQKTLASLSAVAITFSLFGGALVAQAAVPVQVSIEKYMDGVQATAVNANSTSFPMIATYTISGTPGTGPFTLNPSGFSPGDAAYEAKTGGLTSGDNYGTSEDTTTGVVSSVCDGSAPYSLVGYTSGTTLAAAQAATPTAVAPSFVGLTQDMYVIVWNHDCAVVIPPPTPTTVKVTIEKYVNGVQATASSSNSATFPMTATYNAANTGAGTGTYDLSASGYNGDPTPYQAMTIDFTSGADYATNEVLTGTVVAASCASADVPFELIGYTTGDTLLQAQSATPSTTTPSFTAMTSDKFVIVWNKTCSNFTGGLGGTVTGGASTPVGVLHVDSVTATKTTAIADGTFANGWIYTFNITVPDNETHLAMKFADWASTVGSTTLAVANNMRISSAQADNSGATVLLTAANIYSSPTLHMTGDLNPTTNGKQVQVVIEVAVPSSTVNGSYTTSYGVNTQ